MNAIEELNPKKAPGEDDITEICTGAYMEYSQYVSTHYTTSA